jgi:hypothetical protein
VARRPVDVLRQPSAEPSESCLGSRRRVHRGGPAWIMTPPGKLIGEQHAGLDAASPAVPSSPRATPSSASSPTCSPTAGAAGSPTGPTRPRRATSRKCGASPRPAQGLDRCHRRTRVICRKPTPVPAMCADML